LTSFVPLAWFGILISEGARFQFVNPYATCLGQAQPVCTPNLENRVNQYAKPVAESTAALTTPERKRLGESLTLSSVCAQNSLKCEQGGGPGESTEWPAMGLGLKLCFLRSDVLILGDYE